MTSRSLVRAAAPWTALCAALTTAAALTAAACAQQSNYEAKHLPDGTLHLKCEGALTACIARAETACHGNNYEVLKARDQRDMLGHENGAVQVEVRTSEAIIRCGARGQPAPPLPPDAIAPPPPPPPAAVAVPPPPPARSCVPGATQACIGPGRCDGGQSCLPDGSAFGPCDCGTLGPPPGAAPPPPPTAATAAPPGPPPTSVAPAAPGAKPLPPSTAPAGPAKPLKK